MKTFKSALNFAVFIIFTLSGCTSFGSSGRAATPEEQAFLDNYMKNLEYCLYFKKDSPEDSFLKDTAVRIAAKYVPARKMIVLNTAVPKFSEMTVAVELDALTGGESNRGNHYGFADVKCTLVEPLFENNLRVWQDTAPRTFSNVSQFDAKANALQSAFSSMIPKVVEQSQDVLLELYGKGILYELVIQQMSDGSLTKEFQKALALRVRSLRIVNGTEGEKKYRFAVFGNREDVQTAVFDAAASVAGLEKIRFVSAEGRRIIFAMGL